MMSKMIFLIIRILVRFIFSIHPWDSYNDISTYEHNFLIDTRTCQDSIKEKLLDDDMISILNRIERNLINTNQRIEFHENEIHYLQNQQIRNTKTDFSSFYIQFFFLIFVVIILKYIFR